MLHWFQIKTVFTDPYCGRITRPRSLMKNISLNYRYFVLLPCKPNHKYEPLKILQLMDVACVLYRTLVEIRRTNARLELYR